MDVKARAIGASLAMCACIVLVTPSVAVCELNDSVSSLPPIFAVRDDDKLCLVLNNQDSVLYESEGWLEAISLSPDGRYLTAYVPRSSGSGVLSMVPGQTLFSSDIKTDLVIFDRYARSRVEFDEVKFRRVFSPRDITYATFLPPMWLDDCERFYLPSRDGVELAHISGTTDSLIHAEKLTAMARAPRTTRCTVSNERAVFLVDTVAALTQTLIDTARAKAELGGRIRALAYSSDGQSLAIGHDRTVSILDARTAEIRDYGKAPRDIYWLGWLPDDTGLVILCGTEERKSSFRNAAISSGTLGGGFQFCVLSDGDPESRKVYGYMPYDVRRVNPMLSGDAGAVVFTSLSNMEIGTLMVLSLDGRKAFRLTKHYRYRSPVWAPWVE